MKIDNWFIQLIKWFAGFFQDQKGEASRKAIALYICLYYFKIMIDASLEGKTIDKTVLFYLLGIILFCLGAITAEFFANFPTSTKSTTTTIDTNTTVEKKDTNIPVDENKES